MPDIFDVDMVDSFSLIPYVYMVEVQMDSYAVSICNKLNIFVFWIRLNWGPNAGHWLMPSLRGAVTSSFLSVVKYIPWKRPQGEWEHVFQTSEGCVFFPWWIAGLVGEGIFCQSPPRLFLKNEGSWSGHFFGKECVFWRFSSTKKQHRKKRTTRTSPEVLYCIYIYIYIYIYVYSYSSDLVGWFQLFLEFSPLSVKMIQFDRLSRGTAGGSAIAAPRARAGKSPPKTRFMLDG